MIKAILLDLDGTVYNGNTIIDGADKAIENMRKNGIHVYFCTNNSSLIPHSIMDKLKGMKIECEEEDVLTSGKAALGYIKRNKLKKVFISGSDELKNWFKENKVDICNENHAETLVIGMDSKFDYEKMTKGIRAAINSKTIIVCNQDRIFMKEDGVYPGCGGMTSSISYCSGKEPDVIIGKPNVFMIRELAEDRGYSKDELLVIGDSDVDVKMAADYGCRSLLIGKTGEHRLQSLKDTVNWDWKIIQNNTMASLKNPT